MFAQNETGLFNENSEMRPRSPYATAKYKNHKKVLNLRKRIRMEHNIWDIV